MFIWIKVRKEANQQAQIAWKRYASCWDIDDVSPFYVMRNSESTSREDAFWARVAKSLARKLELRLRRPVSVETFTDIDCYEYTMQSPRLIIT